MSESLIPDGHSDCGCESSQGGLCNRHAEEVNGSSSLFTDARDAIARERERRHWTIQQWKEDAPDEHWPAYVADTRKAADDAADWLVDALTTLRGAWNAHFESCPAPMLNVPQPTWEQLQEWANAPSDTASATDEDYARRVFGSHVTGEQ